MKAQLKTTSITARQNGNKSEMSRTETFTEISTTKMTSIVSTPYRFVDVLESGEGMFIIREVSLTVDSHTGVARVWLKPHEMIALRNALNKLKIMDGESA